MPFLTITNLDHWAKAHICIKSCPPLNQMELNLQMCKKVILQLMKIFEIKIPWKKKGNVLLLPLSNE